MIKHKMSNPRRQKRPMRNDSIAVLMASAKSGDPEVIRHKASELGTDLNLVYPGGRTLLTKAIEDNENLSTIEAIIKSGANVDVPNLQGKTALMVAIRIRRPDVLNVLLESGANQDLVTHKNSSVFTQCLKEGLFSYLEILLKNVREADSICEKVHVMTLFIRQRDKKFTTKSQSHFGETDLGLKQGIIQAIKNGCRVNCTDLTGTSPLMHAVKCHYDDCVRLLLLAGADVNKINKRKETALIIAMTRGSSPILPDLIMAGAFIKHPKSKTSSMHFEMFKKIIDYLQQNGLFNMQDIHGKTALMYAAERGDRNCIRYAIEADIEEFAKMESLLERKNSSSASCVHVSDNAGLFSSICKCKEPEGSRCVDFDIYATELLRKYKEKNGRPLLMYAFETGRRLPDLYIQLRACDDACYRDEYGRTVLMNYFKLYQQNTGVYITQALFNKAPPELLETLSSLKYAFEISYKSIQKLFGGQVNIRDNDGNSTVIYAIKYYEFITEEIVELLVGDTQREQYEDGKSALMIALQAYKDQAARYIKSLIGDSFNIQNKEGKTALMYALSNTRDLPENRMKLMIGDSQNIQDKDGKTGLMYAILCESDLSDNLIIQMIGDSQNIQDNEGKTALMYAILSKRYFSENLITQMIGYSQNVQDNDGKTALMYAILSKGYISDNLIIKMLGDSQNVQDNDGKTALMYAFIHNVQFSEETIEHLAGKNPFIQDKSGKTALMYALKFNQYLTYGNIKYLYGGKVNICDNEGNTTVLYAVKYYIYMTEEIIALLVGDTQTRQFEGGKTTLMIALEFFNAHFQEIKLLFNRNSYYFLYQFEKNVLVDAIRTLSSHLRNEVIERHHYYYARGNYLKPLIGDTCNIQDDNGKTALMYAMINTRDISDNLIKQIIGGSQNILDNDGKTALMHALINTKGITDTLIKQMIGDSRNVQDKNGKTALMHAFINRVYLSKEMVDYLAGENPLIQDKSGKTALMYAFQFNRRLKYKTIKELFGGKVNIRDNEGNTPIVYALKYCTYINKKITNMLVGDSQNTKYKDGKTALMIALQNGKHSNDTYRFIQPLIGNSCNAQDDEGKTALMYAFKHERDLPDDLIREMISDSLHIQDNKGKTALMYAMKHKHNLSDHLIKQMIRDTQYVKDKKGKTALMYVSQRSHFSNAFVINLFNVDLLNVQDTLGKTALHYAIEHNRNEEYLKHLISHGANLEIEDNDGRTALMLCLEIESRENESFYRWTEYFLITKQFLQFDPLPRLNTKGTLFLFTFIEKEMFSLMNLHENKEILRLMFANGVVPFPNSRSKFSTLFGVLKHNLKDVAIYVIANMCLTNDDLKMLNKAKNFLKANYNARNHRTDFNLKGLDLSSPHLKHLVIDATSQPWPLVKLSFIAVNSAVGHGVNREQRIKMLPLPQPIKDMLMFHTRTALLPVSEWANIPMVFDPVEYEKTRRPRPLLNFWPFGEVLVV